MDKVHIIKMTEFELVALTDVAMLACQSDMSSLISREARDVVDRFHRIAGITILRRERES